MKSGKYYFGTPEFFKSSVFLRVRSVLFAVLFFICLQPFAQAQETEIVRSSWWLGVAGGANYNVYSGGSPQRPGNDLVIPYNGYVTGKGTGYFALPILEYHPENKNWGFFLQAGYDNRIGTFANGLTTKIAYLTIEPALRLNFPNSGLFIYAGPRVAVNTDKRFTFQQQSGTLDFVKTSVSGFQTGVGYDIFLTTNQKKAQVILSPFFSFQPYFGQSPRTIDSWNVTTLRAGMAFKFGRARQFAGSRNVVVPVSIEEASGAKVVFNDLPPAVNEETPDDKTGPLGSRAFYDLSTSEITNPDERIDHRRIREISKALKSLAAPENLSEDLRGQLIVEDNFLTLLGEQMQKDLSGTVRLIGSSKNGARYGVQLAKSAKIFLTRVFRIDGSRIKTKGQKNLKIKSGKQKAPKNLAVIFEKDRQVLMKSNSPGLQNAFRGGSGESAKPLKMKVVNEPDVNGYVYFKTSGLGENPGTWFLKIANDEGQTQNFGPYTGETARIPKQKILGKNTVGQYRITMHGQLKSGQVFSKDTTAFIRIYPLNVGEKYTRFGISYQFNDLQSIADLKRYLAEVVAPEIPERSNVIIHGHSNVVEDMYFDVKRFLAEANDAGAVLRDALEKAGKTNVRFSVYGLGDDQVIEPFRKPDEIERHYYRTLIVDVVPQQK